MVADACLPFAFVENRGFVAYSEALHPGFPVPARRAIARRVRDLYQRGREVLASKFEDEGVWQIMPSITVDGWTATNGEGFLSVTIHMIQKDWKPLNASMGVVYLKPPHDAVSIADCVRETLRGAGWSGEG